jgi:mono/diheme cytochrome c family protein
MLVSKLRVALATSTLLALACSPPPAPAPSPGGSPPGNDDPGQMPAPGGNNMMPGPGIMDPPATPPGAMPDPTEVFPFVAHLGYDGTRSYKVPMLTNLAGSVTWSFSDPALATATPIPTANVPADLQQIPGVQWVMIESKKAGMGKVTASNGTQSASADVVITAYTNEQYQAGQTRYMNGCAGCHGGAGGVDHSPTILVFNPDAELVLAITTGKYSDGYTLRAPNHSFTLNDVERAGIVSYIRSLPPKDFK